jgi:hypothetical protein
MGRCTTHGSSDVQALLKKANCDKNGDGNMKTLMTVLSVLMMLAIGAGTATAMMAEHTPIQGQLIEGQSVRLGVTLTATRNNTLQSVQVRLESADGEYDNYTYVPDSMWTNMTVGDTWTGYVNYTLPKAGKYYYSFKVIGDRDDELTHADEITIKSKAVSGGSDKRFIPGFELVIIVTVIILTVFYYQKRKSV